MGYKDLGQRRISQCATAVIMVPVVRLEEKAVNQKNDGRSDEDDGDQTKYPALPFDALGINFRGVLCTGRWEGGGADVDITFRAGIHIKRGVRGRDTLYPTPTAERVAAVTLTSIFKSTSDFDGACGNTSKPCRGGYRGGRVWEGQKEEGKQRDE